MNARIGISLILIGGFLSVPGYAKGPKDATPAKKYQSGGGYSGGAVISKSKYSKSPASPSVWRIPSQPPITKKYRSPMSVSPSRASTSAASVSKKYDRYSKTRPNFSHSQTPVQPSGAGSGRPPSTVRFPTRPTTPSSPGSGYKQKTQPAPAQSPPVVFYPKPNTYYAKPSTGCL